MTTHPVRTTLPGSAYHSEETWRVDQERVFYRNWVYVARAERLPRPGSWLRAEIAGESILLVRGKDEVIRGFYNVCRHRGSRLCEDEQGFTRSHLRCPYHAWGYALDGTLVQTPMIEKDEIDRETTSLWPVRVEVWEGFCFVNLSREEPRALLEHLADQTDDALSLARVGLAELRIGHISTVDVAANWKIVLENYQECLHCPTVHPELVAVVPAYKKGWVTETGRDDGGVTLADGRTTLAVDPRLRLPLLPGLREQEGPAAYFGAAVYPTMFLDVDGSTALATAVFPTGPRSCRLVTEYLFSPEALEDPDFDPSPVVEFNELVTRQDNEACERVQVGVASRAFTHGVFPAKDSFVHAFDERYRRDVE
ncbi:aromatic ring-hydroxylating dioxygenase subunit alpha [Nocardioides mangrovicus]|uniref:Aromatic ring-hydroxylating dioxygenase subunit alpha n=1 Tax=Nocardioides mangrovicus TaxID=2478913 RepID=A0A3L8P6B6_9ACTN|nr:aromatic ring-hydroxylating dioxygenase subunit alpha [Nocardioides mangrovicus]RLV50771.1 aromatic ring-hydroxylating dioxygenase subunit alpha [Nocardioides mangrovicus]